MLWGYFVIRDRTISLDHSYVLLLLSNPLSAPKCLLLQHQVTMDEERYRSLTAGESLRAGVR